METEHTGTYGPFINVCPAEYKYVKKGNGEYQSQDLPYAEFAKLWSNTNPDPAYDLTDSDVELLGYAAYLSYYRAQSKERMDAAPLANYAHQLAKKLNSVYLKERIKDGRYGFQYAVYVAWYNLGVAMTLLGMFKLDEV